MQKTIEGKDLIKPLDALMWVGEGFYSKESFIKEAKRLGVCKRFGGGIPADLIIRKSRIFLAFKKAGEETGEVFAYFVLRNILVVGDPTQLAAKEGAKIQRIGPSEAAAFMDRGCGTLVIGGTYFVSEEDMQKLQKYADAAEGRIVVLDPAVLTTAKRYRGYRYVNGDKLLSWSNEVEWFDVNAQRKENFSSRKKLMLPSSTSEKQSKPKRASYRETTLRTLDELDFDAIELEGAIQSCVFQNQPFASNPRRVYRAVIGMLASEGVLSFEKKNGAIILKLDKKALAEAVSKLQKKSKLKGA